MIPRSVVSSAECLARRRGCVPRRQEVGWYREAVRLRPFGMKAFFAVSVRLSVRR